MKTVLDSQQQLLRLLHENQTTVNHLGRLYLLTSDCHPIVARNYVPCKSRLSTLSRDICLYKNKQQKLMNDQHLSKYFS